MLTGEAAHNQPDKSECVAAVHRQPVFVGVRLVAYLYLVGLTLKTIWMSQL